MKIKKFKQREKYPKYNFFPITHSILQKATSKGQDGSQELDFCEKFVVACNFQHE